MEEMVLLVKDLDGVLTVKSECRSHAQTVFRSAPGCSPLGPNPTVADGSGPLTIEWKWSSKCLKIHTGLYLKFDC